eukprot:NODE_1894_length_478_cov_43.410256_g1816_i0.p2 GENE.NODE_1894_length_478_cov_43.410256_g1816_i0~~NODE_1894_length_478_cov_43.410256_g1816_i0.p2  ORF type:complete len:59 (+),score=7.72 NODE_1894_length_478_cov_43.410256_g1816_i0:28-204(+)
MGQTVISWREAEEKTFKNEKRAQNKVNTPGRTTVNCNPQPFFAFLFCCTREKQLESLF